MMWFPELWKGEPKTFTNSCLRLHEFVATLAKTPKP